MRYYFVKYGRRTVIESASVLEPLVFNTCEKLSWRSVLAIDVCRVGDDARAISFIIDALAGKKAREKESKR